MAIHVFIDNSNIIGGAQGCAAEQEPHVPWVALRVYFRNLFAVLEKGRERLTAVMGGSVPPGNEELWAHARGLGYETDLLKRVETDDGRLAEQGVDEGLHLKMANALLDHEPPQTMVLATGDGQRSDLNTSFVEQLQRALNHGWNVELYAWANTISGRLRTLADSNPGRMSVTELDNLYLSLTFVRPGTYKYKTGGWNEFDVEIAERIVSPLPRQR